jgi:hypothetical protein
MKPILTLPVALFALNSMTTAQIRPPGYEREVKAMEERSRTSVLEKDSVVVIDTISLFDPVTYQETMRIVSSDISWRDYCMFRLGINKPEDLLDGQPMTLMDPRTYESITVQWNAAATKLDTIR